MTGDRLLYVGSYAETDAPGIHVFRWRQVAAPLHLSSYSGITNPSFVLPHPGGDHVYAVSETDPGAVQALVVDRSAGTPRLHPINTQPSGGAHPCHLALDSTGRWLTVANYTGGTVSVLPIAADGSLDTTTATVQHTGSGPNPHRQEAPHPHATAFSPDSRFLVVADLGMDRLVVYRFDAEAGTLAHHRDVAPAPGAGPRHLAFHPDGTHIHVVNELDNTLASYTFGDNGDCSLVGVVSTLVSPDASSQAAAIRVSPDGDRLFVSNRGEDTIAMFAFEVGSRPRSLGHVPCGGLWPRDMTLTPDRDGIVVANRRSNRVVGMTFDSAEAEWQVELPEPSSVAFGSLLD